MDVAGLSARGCARLHEVGRVRLLIALSVVLFAALLAIAEPAMAADDTTPPQILSFSLAPAEVNTDAADQTVTATMRLTDDQAGVSSTDDAGVSSLRLQIQLNPLIGTQSVMSAPRRISGTDRDGVYTATLTLPRGSKEGMWTLVCLNLPDKLGNYVQLTSDDLSALFPTAGVLVANTAAAQQVTIDRQWTLSAADCSVAFPAGTVVTRADDGRFAFYQMTAQEFTLDDSVPTTNLDGVPVATVRFGIPGLNLAFSQPVTVSMQVGSRYDGYLLDIQSLTEGGGAWANEKTVGVANGRCSFTVSHATRFAASVTPPIVTKFTPASGKRGATITITGKGFGKKRGTSFVRFGAAKCAKYVSWSATRIRCKVPAKAKFGKLKVRVVTPAGASNAKTFTVKR